MKFLPLIFVVSACTGPAAQNPRPAPAEVDPDHHFLRAVNAVVQVLATSPSGPPDYRVDPRPVAANTPSAVVLDAPEAARRRAHALEAAGIRSADILEAAECAHVGGMGGLLMGPAKAAQERLLERCADWFGGFTFAVSPPAAAGGGDIRFRVLAYEVDSEFGWDVTLHADGSTREVKQRWRLVS